MAQTLIARFSHVVFSTKRRENLIAADFELPLHRYMCGIVRQLESKVLAVGGTENHVHLLISESKNFALTGVMRELKKSSSRWVNSGPRLRGHFSWQDGYGSFTVSHSNLEAVAEYIRNQKQHHQRMSFEDEFLGLARKHRLEFDPDLIWK